MNNTASNVSKTRNGLSSTISCKLSSLPVPEIMENKSFNNFIVNLHTKYD